MTPSMRTGLIQFAIGGVAGPALFAVLNWASVQVITEPMSSRTGPARRRWRGARGGIRGDVVAGEVVRHGAHMPLVLAGAMAMLGVGAGLLLRRGGR